MKVAERQELECPTIPRQVENWNFRGAMTHENTFPPQNWVNPDVKQNWSPAFEFDAQDCVVINDKNVNDHCGSNQ